MLDRRAVGFGRVAPRLVALDDDSLVKLVGDAAAVSRGIGGSTGIVDVDGVEVFVKQVPVTDVELAAPHDTSNLFGLPGFYQYGIGSAGFSAWRELTAHRITTAWVRSGRQPNFPLLYHWRVLPRVVVDLVDVEERTAFWDGDAFVRRRLEALNSATHAVTLFLERIPHGLGPWLQERIDRGDEHAAVEVGGRLSGGGKALK